MNKWIRRKRNSWGYGVQSPSDFYFVQHVLRERSPYYGYEVLGALEERYASLLPSYPSATNRLLLRLADYAHSALVVEVGASLSTLAMVLGHPAARHIAITAEEACHAALRPLLASYPQVEVRKGDEMALFGQLLHEASPIGTLHVAYTERYREVVDAALPHMADGSLIIIEGIADSREKHAWWQSLQESPSTGISYDLGHIGLLLFAPTRHKQNYWINLRKRV